MNHAGCGRKCTQVMPIRERVHRNLRLAALAVALSAEAGNPGVDPGAGLPADPARLAAIAVFAGLCVTLAVLGFRVHALRSANRCLEARVEELCDENWELSDAEEHAKSV